MSKRQVRTRLFLELKRGSGKGPDVLRLTSDRSWAIVDESKFNLNGVCEEHMRYLLQHPKATKGGWQRKDVNTFQFVVLSQTDFT